MYAREQLMAFVEARKEASGSLAVGNKITVQSWVRT